MVFFSRFHILKLSSSQFFKSIKNQYRGINYVQMYRSLGFPWTEIGKLDPKYVYFQPKFKDQSLFLPEWIFTNMCQLLFVKFRYYSWDFL